MGNLYELEAIHRDYPNFPAEKFCSNKGITQEQLGAIVREFDNLNDGKRWGVGNGINL
jgi:hypothetical protein